MANFYAALRVLTSPELDGGLLGAARFTTTEAAVVGCGLVLFVAALIYRPARVVLGVALLLLSVLASLTIVGLVIGIPLGLLAILLLAISYAQRRRSSRAEV